MGSRGSKQNEPGTGASSRGDSRPSTAPVTATAGIHVNSRTVSAATHLECAPLREDSVAGAGIDVKATAGIHVNSRTVSAATHLECAPLREDSVAGAGIDVKATAGIHVNKRTVSAATHLECAPLREDSVVGAGIDVKATAGIHVNNRTVSAATHLECAPLREDSVAGAGIDDDQRQPPIAREVIPQNKSNKLICAAIDFGTTFSGYAYSFASRPAQVYTNYWSGTAIKTPTCVLMDHRKQFHSFGYDAQKKYAELIKTGEYRRWYYFHHFKLKLYVKSEPLQKDMTLEDMTGKYMLAMDVFSAAIHYMKDHLLKVLNARDSRVTIKPGDIHWVITVPAIWNDLSKLFMRQAARKAGIPTDFLTLALEPEAASIYCQETIGSATLHPGCRYVVFDLGGGTADLTSHEVQNDGTLKELHRASGGDYGATLVDNQFLNTLRSIFGAALIQKFKDTDMEAYFDLVKSFELQKQSFGGSESIRMQFPAPLIEMYEDDVGMTIGQSMEQSPLNEKVEFKLGRMFITSELATEYFDTAVNSIFEDTNDILSNVDNIEYLILVGGFSKSPYVVKRLQMQYQNLALVPEDPASAVLKGAVIYGHRTKAISSRICKFTYGIAIMMIFEEDIHRHDKILEIDGTQWCDDLFDKHIEIGQQVSVDDDVQSKDYYPVAVDHRQAVLEVYASDKTDVMYIDGHGCHLVGLIKLDIQAKNRKDKILVKLLFGGTELVIEATEVRTNKVVQAYIDFL